MRRKRSISLPIVLASVTVALAVALLIGWTLVVVQNLDLTERVAQNVTVLVLGILSFLTIIAVLLLHSIFLVRRIREINRQYTFIDSVTHELKSPLASLRLAVETLERDDLPGSGRDQMHRMMIGDIERLNAFIDDVLTASRLAYHRKRRELSPVDLVGLVGAALQTARERHDLPAGTLSLEAPPTCFAQTDPMGLSLVLANLLDNAVKYSRSESGVSPILVQVARAERKVLVSVSDRGIGIDKKYRRRIFERFFRVPSDEVLRRHGTGLGLFVAAAVTRSLGGKIRVEANPEGSGSVFKVHLPAGAESSPS